MEKLKEELIYHPDDIKLLTELSHLCQQQGNRTQAIGYLEQAIKHHPKDAELHYQMGTLLVSDPHYAKKALAHFVKVLEIQPGHPQKALIQRWINTLEERIKRKG
jgi:tetratricopeptide (TPR) repeat protein